MENINDEKYKDKKDNDEKDKDKKEKKNTIELSDIHIDTKIINKDATQRDDFSDSTSSDTQNRVEMLWSKRIEKIIYIWNEKCLKNAIQNEKIARRNKSIFYLINIPSAVMVFIMSTLPSNLLENNSTIFSIILVFVGILSTVNAFLNPGESSAQHYGFSSSYNELSVEIMSEMSKPRGHRQDADVFLQRIMDRFNNLNTSVPLD